MSPGLLRLPAWYRMVAKGTNTASSSAEPAPQSPPLPSPPLPFPPPLPLPFPLPLPWPPLGCATAVTSTVLPAGTCPVGCTDTTVPGPCWSLVIQAFGQ